MGDGFSGGGVSVAVEVCWGGVGECSCAEPQVWVIHTPAPLPSFPQSIVQIFPTTHSLTTRPSPASPSTTLGLAGVAGPTMRLMPLSHAFLPCLISASRLCNLSSRPPLPHTTLPHVSFITLPHPHPLSLPCTCHDPAPLISQPLPFLCLLPVISPLT